jgi:hypothetical protein
MDNHYELFSASGMDFIVFYLEWDDGNCSWPANGSSTGRRHSHTCQNVMVWMRNLIVNTPPNRRVIISSHFVGTPSSGGPGTMTSVEPGTGLSQLAKPLPNVFLMMGGHRLSRTIASTFATTATRSHGRPDYQTRPNGGTAGCGSDVRSRGRYDPHRDVFAHGVRRTSHQQVTLHADDQPSELNGNELTLALQHGCRASYQPIGTNASVAERPWTCVSWPGLLTEPAPRVVRGGQ